MPKQTKVTIIEHTVRSFLTQDEANFNPYNEDTYDLELPVNDEEQENRTDAWEFV